MKKNRLLFLFVATSVLSLTGCSDETKDIIIKADTLTMDNFSTGYDISLAKRRTWALHGRGHCCPRAWRWMSPCFVRDNRIPTN